MRTETIGDAVLSQEFVPVLEQMGRAGFEGQVLERVVQRVSVDVMDHVAGRNFPMGLHPYELRSSHPDIRIAHLHKRSAFILSSTTADYDRTHRHLAQRLLAALPLGCRGQVNAFHAGIPGGVTSGESIGWPLSRSVLVALEPRMGHRGQPRSCVPLPTALEGAEPRSISAIRLHGESGRAGLAYFADHDDTVAHSPRSRKGPGTIGVAEYRQPRLFTEPAPRAVQEALL